MPSASNARPRSASSSATGERTGSTIQSVLQFEVVGQVGGALRVGRQCPKPAGVLQQKR